MQGLLRVDPSVRPTAEEALNFPWLHQTAEESNEPLVYKKLTVSEKERNEAITKLHMEGLVNMKLFAHRAHAKVNHS